MGTIETLLGSAITYLVWGLIGGQPMILMGLTGPIAIFVGVVYDWAVLTLLNWMKNRRMKLPFFVLYEWTGIWTSLLLLLIIAFNKAMIVIILIHYYSSSHQSLHSQRMSSHLWLLFCSLWKCSNTYQRISNRSQSLHQKLVKAMGYSVLWSFVLLLLLCRFLGISKIRTFFFHSLFIAHFLCNGYELGFGWDPNY